MSKFRNWANNNPLMFGFVIGVALPLGMLALFGSVGFWAGVLGCVVVALLIAVGAK